MRYPLPAAIALLTLACEPAQKPVRHRVDFRYTTGALPDLGQPEVRVHFDGGACCPDHSIHVDFKEKFRKTILSSLHPVFPKAKLVETVDPAENEWQMEVDFALAEEHAGPSGKWPCLIEVIVARSAVDVEANFRRAEVAFWSRKLVYGDQERILQVLKGQLKKLVEAAARQPTQPAHVADAASP